MEEEYLVPDYYPAFRCKMGACRRACCEGWPINISLQDYFRLTGEMCSEELRRRIDSGVRVNLHPTPDAYACISPGWDGMCPMHLPDGRCAIHAELGDGALSAVCRLYPRGVRTQGGREASCANSCEAVVEMLLHHPQPLRFAPLRMDVNVPEPPMLLAANRKEGEQAHRMQLIAAMQDRAKPLPERLMHLGRMLTGEPMPDLRTAGDLPRSLHLMEKLLELLDDRSNSLHDYGEAAIAYFRTGDAQDCYHRARARFEGLFPDWEIGFENLLVNHMFFERFPYQDRPLSHREEIIALCAVYALLRCVCLGWMAAHDAEEDLVDVISAAFRLIDHASFDAYAASALMDLGVNSAGDVWGMVAL